VSPALFHDVSPGSWGASFVNTLALAGVTAGCGTLRFCPDEPVTRAQMAILLLRAALGPSAAPLPATGTVFVDVDAHAFGADWIEQLAGMGVTAGCGGGAYCPDRAITRAETAVLLLRARHGASYRPLSATGSMFDDVPAGHPLAAWIEQLAAEGITAGCGGGRYCPDSVVTRAEMAVFLVRAFALARPLP
jgi:hypothetical protein